jgi:hypothetical protein
MNNNCIYYHLKPCGEVFYIGIGNDKRPNSKQNRNKYWHNIIEKYGYEVQILKNDLSWEDAIELEILLISWFGRKDLKLGTLVNMTDGGEGNKNIVMTPESNMKRSLSSKGIPKTNKGVKRKGHSKETKDKMSLAKKGVKTQPHSEERKAKMRESALNRKIRVYN